MEHKPYLRLISGSHTALLLVHGILGTPNHFSAFLPLVDPNWSVYNILLDGHGKGVREFSRTSMKIWRRQVEYAVDMLAKDHENILIVGHSLGCLLAVEQAICCPKIAGLFLIAPPLKLRLRLQMVTTSAKVYFGRVHPSDAPALAAQRVCGVRHQWQFWRYLGWIPRFLELFHRIDQTHALLPQLQTPCHVIHSCRDEMVSAKALAYFPSFAEIHLLEQSSHFYYSPEDEKKLLQQFVDFCNPFP